MKLKACFVYICRFEVTSCVQPNSFLQTVRTLLDGWRFSLSFDTTHDLIKFVKRVPLRAQIYMADPTHGIWKIKFSKSLSRMHEEIKKQISIKQTKKPRL